MPGCAPVCRWTVRLKMTFLWIRDPFLLDSRDHGPLVVHGHTALPQACHYRNRLNIDSSAAYGGPLSAVVLEGRRVWLLAPQGRVELSPL